MRHGLGTEAVRTPELAVPLETVCFIIMKARQFDVNGIGINRVWIADMTYIPTREGWLYLATVLDLGSRRCVGWAMRDTMEVELPLSALRMACERRHPAAGLIHHSD